MAEFTQGWVALIFKLKYQMSYIILYKRGNIMEDSIFDYRSLGMKMAVPEEIVKNFEKEALNEFPFDNMLMEIHVLRAVKAYAKTQERMVLIEN